MLFGITMFATGCSKTENQQPTQQVEVVDTNKVAVNIRQMKTISNATDKVVVAGTEKLVNMATETAKTVTDGFVTEMETIADEDEVIYSKMNEASEYYDNPCADILNIADEIETDSEIILTDDMDIIVDDVTEECAIKNSGTEEDVPALRSGISDASTLPDVLEEIDEEVIVDPDEEVLETVMDNVSDEKEGTYVYPQSNEDLETKLDISFTARDKKLDRFIIEDIAIETIPRVPDAELPPGEKPPVVAE